MGGLERDDDEVDALNLDDGNVPFGHGIPF
jgi:hypothetical protein